MCGGAPVVEEGDRGGKQGVRLQKPLEVVRLSRHCPLPLACSSTGSILPGKEPKIPSRRKDGAAPTFLKRDRALVRKDRANDRWPTARNPSRQSGSGILHICIAGTNGRTGEDQAAPAARGIARAAKSLGHSIAPRLLCLRWSAARTARCPGEKPDSRSCQTGASRHRQPHLFGTAQARRTA